MRGEYHESISLQQKHCGQNVRHQMVQFHVSEIDCIRDTSLRTRSMDWRTRSEHARWTTAEIYYTFIMFRDRLHVLARTKTFRIASHFTDCFHLRLSTACGSHFLLHSPLQFRWRGRWQLWWSQDNQASKCSSGAKQVPVSRQASSACPINEWQTGFSKTDSTTVFIKYV